MKRLYGVILLVLLIIGISIDTSYSTQVTGVTVTEDQTIADKFNRYTVTGITTPLPESPDIPGFIGASYLTIGDIDKDGAKEIISTSGIGKDAEVLTPDGAVAIFTWDCSTNACGWKQSIVNETFAWPNETIVRDMDGDGDEDIMVMDNFILASATGAPLPAGIYYLENQGGNITTSSNWIKRTIYQGDPATEVGRASYHRAYFLDLDGDGLEDFVNRLLCHGTEITDRENVGIAGVVENEIIGTKKEIAIGEINLVINTIGTGRAGGTRGAGRTGRAARPRGTGGTTRAGGASRTAGAGGTGGTARARRTAGTRGAGRPI